MNFIQPIIILLFGKTNNPTCMQLQLFFGLLSAILLNLLVNDIATNIPDVTSTFGLLVNCGIALTGFLLGTLSIRLLIETKSLFYWIVSTLRKCKSKNSTSKIKNSLSATVETERLENFLTLYPKLKYSTQKAMNDIISSKSSFNYYDEPIAYLEKNKFISIKATLEDNSHIYECLPYLKDLAKEKWEKLMESHFKSLTSQENYTELLSILDSKNSIINNEHLSAAMKLEKRIDSISWVQIPPAEEYDLAFGEILFKIELEEALFNILKKQNKHMHPKRIRGIALKQEGFESFLRVVNLDS